MDRCTTAVHMLITTLLALVLQLVVAKLLRQIQNRTLSYTASLPAASTRRMRVTIQLEVRIAFWDDAAENPGSEVDVELDVAPEPTEPTEDEVDMPAVQDT